MRILPAAALTASVAMLALAAQAQPEPAAAASQSAASVAADSATSPPPANPLSTVLGKITGTPAGWSRNLDGSYTQAQANVRCPMTFKSFNFQRFQPTDAERPDVLGICYYADGNGRIGSIRVRSYKGSNDKSVLAENDKLLMAKDGAPPILLHTGMDRNGGGRATATVSRNGLLVDCSVWQPEHSVPKSDFLLYCTTLTGS